MRKCICLILIWSMLLTTVPTAGFAAEETDPTQNYIKVKDGFWRGEAEDFEFNEDAFRLITTAPDEMSGGAALQVTYEDKTTPDVTSPADIDLSFTADIRGTYCIWVRNTATQNSVGNSVFLSVNGGSYDYTALKNGTPDVFGWSRLTSIVLDAGESVSVRLKRRQSANIRLDKFLITSTVLYTPSGISGDDDDGSYTLPNEYSMPPVSPTKGEHPRLFFTADDIPKIRENLNHPTNATAKAHFQSMLRKVSTGDLGPNDGYGNYNSTVIQIAEAKAFDYVINGNTASGEEAIAMVFNMLNTADFVGEFIPTRNTGHMMLTCAKVYDWCYPLLDGDEQKEEFIKLMEFHAGTTVPGYPPRDGGTVTSHSSESGMLVDMLSFAIAVYDERPDIYNFTAGRIYEQYVPVRNYWYKSHSYHQGSGYVGARFYWDVVAYWMIKAMTGADLFNADDMHKVFYECIYRTRPDEQYLRLGDDYNEYGSAKGTRWNAYAYLFFLGAMLFDDPYLLSRYEASFGRGGSFGDGGTGQGTFGSIPFMVLNDTLLESNGLSGLAKTMYYPSPNGMMIARTGWDMNYADPDGIDDVLVLMNIGELHAANHDHRDAGSFQIYYKGILASDSGWYGDGYGTPHDVTYHKGSIAHNTIDVYNPLIESDHGQRNPLGGGEPSNYERWLGGDYDFGEVLGYAYGPDEYDPEYSYLKGDVAKAYDSNYVKESVRSMVFMPLEDENYPAALVVFDIVSATSSSYEKSWLLHMQEEPTVDADAKRITVKRTKDGYGGKMDVQTVLPQNAEYEIIGGAGQEFVVNGVNYSLDNANYKTNNYPAEVGWGRVEISPKSELETDYFLNVMTVSDADSTAEPVECRLMERDNYAGVAFLDRVCLFMKSRERVSGTFSIVMPGTGTKKVFVDGLADGMYKITKNGISTYCAANREGGVLYFEAEGGSTYTISYEGNDVSIVKAAVLETVGDEAEVEAYIYGDENANAKVFFALYQDDRLLEIKSKKFEGAGRYVQSFDGDDVSAASRVKVFFNDAKNPMSLLAPSYEI